MTNENVMQNAERVKEMNVCFGWDFFTEPLPPSLFSSLCPLMKMPLRSN